MHALVKDVMNAKPVALAGERTVADAAKIMHDRNIGDVVVQHDRDIVGIVTDRDLVVRCLAEGRDPSKTTLDEVCTHDPVTLRPDSRIDEAITLMRDRAIRRFPVVDGGALVGVVSIGDFALDRDPESALADISKAPPNN